MKIIFIKPNMIQGTPSDSIEPLVFAVLSDLEANELKPLYRSSYPQFGELKPDKSIFKGKKYAPINLQDMKFGYSK